MTNQFSIISFLLFVLFSCGRSNKSMSEKKDVSSITVENLTQKRVDELKNCSFDNPVSDLGIGLVEVPSQFEIFEDSLLTTKYASWDLYEDQNEINICSKFHKPDYGIMHFVCIEKMAKSYKVIINHSEIKYLPIKVDYNFKTWNDYILQSYGIRAKSTETVNGQQTTILKVSPKENAEVLKISDKFEMLCPLEVKGDWVKVKYDCFYNQENNPYEGEPCYSFIEKCQDSPTGWLKWRKENNILIDIFLMP